MNYILLYNADKYDSVRKLIQIKTMFLNVSLVVYFPILLQYLEHLLTSIADSAIIRLFSSLIVIPCYLV